MQLTDDASTSYLGSLGLIKTKEDTCALPGGSLAAAVWTPAISSTSKMQMLTLVLGFRC